ncbi:MAG: helix-turn-helix domain-containing protein [Anaerovoracaceae bacterium]
MKIDKNKFNMALINSKMSLYELSKKAKLSRTTISYIGIGDKKIQHKTLGLIAAALEVDPAELLEEE